MSQKFNYPDLIPNAHVNIIDLLSSLIAQGLAPCAGKVYLCKLAVFRGIGKGITRINRIVFDAHDQREISQ